MVSSRQASGRGDNDESLGTKTNYLQLPIPWFQSQSGLDFRCCNLTCHQTGIWLWERPCENRAFLVAAIFLYWHAIYKHGWLHFVDAASRCWRGWGLVLLPDLLLWSPIWLSQQDWTFEWSAVAPGTLQMWYSSHLHHHIDCTNL